MEIVEQDGTIRTQTSLQLDAVTSAHIFNRTGVVSEITVYIDESILK